VRDFKGLSTRAFDGRGNYTLGLRDQLVFPEVDYAKVEKSKGMNISIVTDAKSDAEALALLRQLGMPFRTEAQRRPAGEPAAEKAQEKAGG
jgi:large subunit ribosomal protein L5